MSSYLKDYRTPAACFKKAPVRRETDIECAWRNHLATLDRDREHILMEHHEGPISRIETPVRREYYTRSTGGKRVRKAKKRKY